MATAKQVDIRGKSDHGGVTALVKFTDAQGNPVDEQQSAFAQVTEYDEQNNPVFSLLIARDNPPSQAKSLPYHKKGDAPAPAPSFSVTPAQRKQSKRPPVPEQPEPNKVPPSPFKTEQSEEQPPAQSTQPIPEEKPQQAPVKQEEAPPPHKPAAPVQQQVPPAGEGQQAPPQQAPEQQAPQQEKPKGPKLDDTMGALQEMAQSGLNEQGALSLAVSVADHSEEDLHKLAETISQQVGTEGIQAAQRLSLQALQRGKQGPPTLQQEEQITPEQPEHSPIGEELATKLEGL